jgi:hypothetical protein
MARGYPDFEGGKQRVYLVPEWAAKEAKDKSFSALLLNAASGLFTFVTYVVPAGKTLYITQLSAFIVGAAAADQDKPHSAIVEAAESGAPTYYWRQGCDTGLGVSLSKPIVFKAGETAWFGITNWANHICHISVLAAGYEV